MDLLGLVEVVQSSALSEWLRSSLKAMPILEAVHVMAIATVFGTVLIVDLRLLGLPSTRRAFTRVAAELLPWTWGAFVLSVITGALLFSVNAITYYNNMPFRLKMLALLGAGLNMAMFHFVTHRRVAAWDSGILPPPTAKVAGAISITLWIAVIFLGRWIGFTKGYDFSIPDDVQLDFTFE